ncbi:hypothetical protein AB0C34_17620 [Nocardia sp. NPDC049220]|uniref:hypothetical protein n=1 Tax=Nocardia sp. NPDC049220 TaxID=3155273 RepID=UPI0033F0ACAE
MTQLDLFGEILATERQHAIDALTCLRDAVPTALEIVATLRYTSTHDTTTPSAGGDWAYCVCKAGLRFQPLTQWQGWNHRPAHLITWHHLATLIGHDPRRHEISAWINTLPHPRWPQLQRPHELWPHPETWHPHHITNDRNHPHWPTRKHAWTQTLTLLTDTINHHTHQPPT